MIKTLESLTTGEKRGSLTFRALSSKRSTIDCDYHSSEEPVLAKYSLAFKDRGYIDLGVVAHVCEEHKTFIIETRKNMKSAPNKHLHGPKNKGTGFNPYHPSAAINRGRRVRMSYSGEK